MKKEEKIGYLTGIISTIIMGFSFYFSKTALNGLENKVFDLLSYRFILSSLGVFLLWKLKIFKLDFKNKRRKPLILMCFFQPVAYFTAEAIGLSMITSSEAGLIMALLPVIIIIMGIIFLKERISFKKAAFAIISIGGAIFINIMGYTPGDSSNLGRIILFLAVIFGSIYSVIARKYSEEFTPMERTTAMMVTGAVAFSLIAILENVYNGTLNQYIANFFNLELFISYAFLGILSSLIAMYLQSIAYTYLEVTKMSIVTNAMIIITIFAGVVLLKENFYWYHILGTLLILIGGIGASLDKNQKKAKDSLSMQEEFL